MAHKTKVCFFIVILSDKTVKAVLNMMIMQNARLTVKRRRAKTNGITNHGCIREHGNAVVG